MQRSLDDIIKELSGWPDCIFQPSVGLPNINAPLRLPDDLVAYYSQFSEARLFGRNSPAYRIVPPHDLAQVNYAVVGEWAEEDSPEGSMYALVDLLDSNFVAIDLAPQRCGLMYDVFHETVGSLRRYKIIAQSFTEFLSGAANAHGRHWWLDPYFVGYGYAAIPGRPPASS
jgi:hypothetical protein